MNGERIARETRLGGALWFDEIGSTNDWAKDWLRGAAANDGREPFASFSTLTPPFVVGANRQTSGRGRGDRRWSSWDGALLFSAVARWSDFRLTRRESAVLSRRIAAAVAETALEFAPNRPIVVKEPNDVYCFGRKLAGILIESPNPESVVVGVGVDVGNRSDAAPPELRDKVVSLVELLDASTNGDWSTRRTANGDLSNVPPPDVDRLREEFAIRALRRMTQNVDSF